MVWKQIEATPSHVTYLVLTLFLLSYAMFSLFIRNRLHLSEPPLALIVGIIIGPRGAGIVNSEAWGMHDDFIMEFTRLIVGIQVFVVGLELPRHYLRRRTHYLSLIILLLPVMTFGWVICILFICVVLKTNLPTAMVAAACLTPTDPVLAASVLSNSQFSTRVPERIKHLLSAESGCNDGVSFPFLFAGLAILTKYSIAATIKEWTLITILWQCTFGTFVGAVIGYAANRALRFSSDRKLIGPSSFVVFYLLLAIFSIGVGSTLGLDDFLVAFGAGTAFSHDGWFAARTRESRLNSILDLMLNSSFFVFFGTIIPWDRYSDFAICPEVTPFKLIGLLILVLLFRRIPIMLALKRWIPDIKTYHEALFCGHFGPMGVGAIFLAIEARAQLENSTSLPDRVPDPNAKNIYEIHIIWIIVTFIVLGSTLVHGLSVAGISVYIHFTRHENRSNVIAGETDPLVGMVHEDAEEEEEEEEILSDMDEDEDRPTGEQDSESQRTHGAANGSIRLPT